MDVGGNAGARDTHDLVTDGRGRPWGEVDDAIAVWGKRSGNGFLRRGIEQAVPLRRRFSMLKAKLQRTLATQVDFLE